MTMNPTERQYKELREYVGIWVCVRRVGITVFIVFLGARFGGRVTTSG